MNKAKVVYILGTGGTISAAGDGGNTTNYLDGKFGVSDLVAGIKGIEQLAQIEYEQVLNVLSDDITEKDWRYLAARIDELAAREEIAGFVITHGTNTMEETAFFLNLTLKTDKPVVITGAMRPATANSADGPQNLYEAVALAASKEARGFGVMTVFADGIYAGSTMSKVNSFRPDAFSSRDFGCIGYMQDCRAILMQRPQRLFTAKSEFDIYYDALPKVGIVYSHIDADPAVLDWFAKNHDAFVIAGTGAGCFNEAWKQKLAEITKDIPVVRSTRTGSGIVSFNHFDEEAGTIPADIHAPAKARILLALALTKTKDKDAIGEYFKRY